MHRINGAPHIRYFGDFQLLSKYALQVLRLRASLSKKTITHIEKEYREESSPVIAEKIKHPLDGITK